MMEYFKGAKGSWIWLVIRLYLGYQWLEAGWHKVAGTDPFDAAGFLKGAIAKSVAQGTAKPVVQPWWGSFLKNVALPNVEIFNFLVAYGEVLVGIALIVGFATLFAATMGIVMNFSFMMSGTVSSSPVLMVLETVILVLGGAYAGYLGVDYVFRPWFRSKVAALFGGDGATAKNAA